MVSNYPSIHDIQLSWYPTIQVSMIFKYPWYSSIRISEKSGIHSSVPLYIKRFQSSDLIVFVIFLFALLTRGSLWVKIAKLSDQAEKFGGHNLKIQHWTPFDLNGLKNGATKIFENSLKSMKIFQILMGGTYVPLSPTSVVLTDRKRTVHFWAALHFYSIANFVASWLKWLQMISNDSKWLHLTY